MKGWASLYEPVIERCKAEGATVQQIKEKFGELRFYVSDASDELRAAIKEAEAKSVTSCEPCGAPARHRNIDGAVKTLCDEHEQELLERIRESEEYNASIADDDDEPA